MRAKGLFCILVLLLLMAGGVAAQDAALDEQPIMQMLTRVPTGVSTSYLLFSDRLAISAAYPGAQMPPDWAAFEALDNDNLTDQTRPLAIWWQVFFQYRSSLSAQTLMLADSLPDSLGYDFFQVQQELSYGQPPENTLYLAGAFDPATITAALAARGYRPTLEAGTAATWCLEGDCSTGMQMNPDARDPANPFGGNLGLSWPLLLGEGFLIGNRSEAAMQAHQQAVEGSAPTLAADAGWRAAVTAATAGGSILLQATALSGNDLFIFSEPFTGLDMSASPEQIQRFYQDLLEDYTNLPPFQLLFVADTVSAGQQVTKVILVYATEVDANLAAAVLPPRVAAYESMALRTSLLDLLAKRGIMPGTVEVQASEGLYTVTVNFTAPQPDIDTLLTLRPGDTPPEGYSPPGSGFAVFSQGIIRRDLGWLSTVPRETIEALAGG